MIHVTEKLADGPEALSDSRRILHVRKTGTRRSISDREERQPPKITAQLCCVAGYLKPYWARLLVVFWRLACRPDLLPAVLTGGLSTKG